MTAVAEVKQAGPKVVRSQSIERAAQILACFSPMEPTLKLADLAARLSLHPSTMYRYVATMEKAGLLTRDAHRGGYRLGLWIIELAGIALNQLEVHKHALDDMDRLRDEVDLLINLGMLMEGDVLHIAHSAPKDAPRIFTSLGRRAVAHCTALGKAMLAHRPWPDVQSLIERYGWRPYTRQSIQDLERLQAELASARERGYALDREERRREVACVAAPIRDYSGAVIAALSASGQLSRFEPPHLEPLILRIVNTANRISLRLGYHGDEIFP